MITQLPNLKNLVFNSFSGHCNTNFTEPLAGVIERDSG